MKARVVTNREIKIAEEIAKQSEQAYMRRILKLVCYALHVQHGFGAKRISQVIKKDVDEAYWVNLDRLLTEHIGIDFANEDYDEREARAKELNSQRKRK